MLLDGAFFRRYSRNTFRRYSRPYFLTTSTEYSDVHGPQADSASCHFFVHVTNEVFPLKFILRFHKLNYWLWLKLKLIHETIIVFSPSP